MPKRKHDQCDWTPRVDSKVRTCRAQRLWQIQDKVLKVNGRLGNELVLLPLRDIFVLQRVSKDWQQVIADSPSLQRKMFLRAESTAVPISENIKENGEPHDRRYDGFRVYFNPILRMRFAIDRSTGERNNPLKPFDVDIERHYAFYGKIWKFDVINSVIDFTHQDKFHEGSWRKMVIMQSAICAATCDEPLTLGELDSM